VDGFGVYRCDRAHYGFFVEYDRGTERAREYAAKLESYYRYRDSGASARDYAGFPTILVITTRAAAEARFVHAAYLAWERRGGKALPILLTTTQLIQQSPHGILGPIWRTAGRMSSREPVRGFWLPGGPRRGRRTTAAKGPLENGMATPRSRARPPILRSESPKAVGPAQPQPP
jgi:hypothetical protein